MKQILQWYSYKKDNDVKELKSIALDGRKIDAALKLYLGHSNFDKIVTKNLFHEEDRKVFRTAKKTRHRIAHSLPEKSEKYFSTTLFETRMKEMDQFISWFR